MHHSAAFALALLLPSAVLAAPFPAGNNKVEKRCCDDAVFWECVGNTAVCHRPGPFHAEAKPTYLGYARWGYRMLPSGICC